MYVKIMRYSGEAIQHRSSINYTVSLLYWWIAYCICGEIQIS